MSNDPYAPCVCGSGKKQKFCCQDFLGDLQRIGKLMDNQPDAAEKLLRTLYAQHSDKEVLVTQLASVLGRQGQFSEARELLVDFLRRHPDEPRVLLALADFCLTTDGFESSRRIVHRAFQLASRQFGQGVSMLASRIAGQMAQAGCAMAVREHLALAVRMAQGDMRKNLLMQLANFESQRSVPYPFRGRFSLLPVCLYEDDQKEHDRARRVSQIGCWEPAAILYQRLCEKHPQDGALWHNLGLCHAWDGRIADAARALHTAAELIENYDTAVETETLAQLLDLEITDEVYGIAQAAIPVQSVSQLLTILDDDDRLARVTDSDAEQSDDGTRIAAEYELLGEFNADGSRDVLADVTVMDVNNPDKSAYSSHTALVAAMDSDIEHAENTFREIVGSLAADADKEPAESPQQVSRLPDVCRLFDWKIHQPEKSSSSRYRDYDQKRLAAALATWRETPLTALKGSTPTESAKDANNVVQVGASVLTLSVTCNRMGYDPDLADMRRELGVPDPRPLELSFEQSLTSLPLLQLSRLQPESLSDQQVVDFANRVAIIGHMHLMKLALEAVISRPDALRQFTPMRAHLMRATIAREANDLVLASECFAAARDAVEHNAEAFRTKLELDIRELSCRLDDPEDPQIPELLRTIRDKYFVKIPEIEGVILEELERGGCEHLLAEMGPVGTAPKALWTPDAENASGSGASGKLWVPGQTE